MLLGVMLGYSQQVAQYNRVDFSILASKGAAMDTG